MSFGKELKDLTSQYEMELELNPLVELIKQRCIEKAKQGKSQFRINKNSDDQLRKVQNNIKKMEELLTDDHMIAKYYYGSYMQDGDDWSFVITW